MGESAEYEERLEAGWYDDPPEELVDGVTVDDAPAEQLASELDEIARDIEAGRWEDVRSGLSTLREAAAELRGSDDFDDSLPEDAPVQSPPISAD